MIVAVAEESRGGAHARQWIEQAKAEYWCLIDEDHRVADLYGMVMCCMPFGLIRRAASSVRRRPPARQIISG